MYIFTYVFTCIQIFRDVWSEIQSICALSHTHTPQQLPTSLRSFQRSEQISVSENITRFAAGANFVDV